MRKKKIYPIAWILICILLEIFGQFQSPANSIDGIYHTALLEDDERVSIYLLIRNGYYIYDDPVRFHAHMSGKLRQVPNDENHYYMTEEIGGYYIYYVGEGSIQLASSIVISDILYLDRVKRLN